MDQVFAELITEHCRDCCFVSGTGFEITNIDFGIAGRNIFRLQLGHVTGLAETDVVVQGAVTLRPADGCRVGTGLDCKISRSFGLVSALKDVILRGRSKALRQLEHGLGDSFLTAFYLNLELVLETGFDPVNDPLGKLSS